ncbi:integrase arm-type DNA-binding domain-containing protein [Novosphingobium sp. APW14]|uniref:tyrosine-type recombinase/integrase n=1 Tax=Novosphingobium sp. APW14 TaxID=3077237 RepID=UPI0028DF29A6|nr:integrase arm-type DNA-binding domain-containing protein [Novosphingobium sp. APW14]MDT9012243.1 integrase arm-type DNA-binding domain-containing protein [Novosphingobium sp. APW14]
MPLTILKVKNAKPGRHVDGRGLCLLVKPSGARTWMLRMQLNGQRRDYGLGSALDVSLAEAREAASMLRRQVREGFDPVAERRKARKVIPTFEVATRSCHETLGDGWKEGHHARWLSGFERHVFPRIGGKQVDQVDSACVAEALSPIWLEVPETARRMLQRIGVVLDFAHVKGWVPEEVSLRSVRKGLPRQNDKRGHMEAMPYAEVPALMRKLANAAPTIGRDALRFTIYNAVRSNETRLAVWTEFDLDNAVWTIPGERMKARETHVVPLSAPTVALLRRRWDERASDIGLVFSKDGKKPISDMTMTKLLRDDGISGVTVHGFRSAFTDWSSECTEYPKEVADKALAHKLPDKVEAAYRRTDFFEKRRGLMKLWADYLDSPPRAEATPADAAAEPTEDRVAA